MKKLQFTFLSLIITLLLLPTPMMNAQENNEIIQENFSTMQSISFPAKISDIFPDDYVANEMLLQLRNNDIEVTTVDDFVTQDDLESIEYLWVARSTSVNLSGAEYLHNVEKISIGTDIENFESLANLANVKGFYIYRSDVINLT